MALSEDDSQREHVQKVLCGIPLSTRSEPECGSYDEPSCVVWEWCDGGRDEVDGGDGGCGDEDGLSAFPSGVREGYAEEREESDGKEE